MSLIHTRKVQVAILVALALLGLIVNLVHAAPALGTKQLPVKGSVQAVETYRLDLPNLTMYVSARGSGNATVLGRFTVEYEAAVNLLNGQGLGTVQIIAANGDLIHADLYGQGIPTQTPDVHHVVETFVITGGTGRFANASGSIFVDRLINTATGVGSGTFEGTIIIP